MTLPIRFVAEAREEFRAQIARYAELDPRFARRFTDVVEAEVGRLSVFPAAVLF